MISSDFLCIDFLCISQHLTNLWGLASESTACLPKIQQRALLQNLDFWIFFTVTVDVKEVKFHL